MIGCLHEPANVQHYSCCKFAGSCKHPMKVEVIMLQNLLVKFDEINASIEDVQSLCEQQILLADSDTIRQQVCLCIADDIVFKLVDSIEIHFPALTTGVLFISCLMLKYVFLLTTQ